MSARRDGDGAAVLKRYAVDMQTKGTVINHNGREEAFALWQQVAEMDATRLSNAARLCDRKWPGRVMRLRLLGRAALNQGERS